MSIFERMRNCEVVESEVALVIEGLVDINTFNAEGCKDVLLSARFNDDRQFEFDMEAGFISVWFNLKDRTKKPMILLCDGGHASNQYPFNRDEESMILQAAQSYLNTALAVA